MSTDHTPRALYVQRNSDVAALGLLDQAGIEVISASPRDAAELIEAVREARPHALLLNGMPVTEELFEAAPDLGIVSVGSVGYDPIDVEAASRYGVWVSNVPDATTEVVAEHALAMALALPRHLPFLDRDVRAGGWDFEATGMPRSLGGLTLGVVGLGRIGRHLATLAEGLFAEVVGYDPVLPADLWPDPVRRLDLEECLGASDVVSLHVPLNAETDHLLDARTLALLPAGAFVINVSRGRLIEPDDLLAALDSGALAGAALDVTEVEPPAADDALRQHPRVLLTPHAAFFSTEAFPNYARGQAANVIAWHRDGRPRTPVNEP